MNNFILLGAPGSGKGTFSGFLEKYFQIQAISTGGILRDEIKKGTEYGTLAAELQKEGKLFPDSLIVSIVNDALSRVTTGFVLDGFPRTLAQAQQFDDSLITKVIHLEADEDVVISRIMNRLSCPHCKAIFNKVLSKPKIEGICDVCGHSLEQRKDDAEQAIILNRLAIYHEQTEPLVAFYQHKGLLVTLDGNQTQTELAAQFLNMQ